jgi:hypothetical protein
VANGISSATSCARAAANAEHTAAISRRTPAGLTAPSARIASASFVGVFSRYTGSGGDPG